MSATVKPDPLLSNTTRRFPRTLVEAFGPHTSNDVQAPDQPPPRSITLYGVAVAMCAVPTIYLVFRVLIALVRGSAR